jgi:hypothetical protein
MYMQHLTLGTLDPASVAVCFLRVFFIGLRMAQRCVLSPC